ncbi:MAG: AmmeMemoRadiSam system protein B [Bryobacteraceae bacterium]|jgi:AmmeMemoRadiSam system protein B
MVPSPVPDRPGLFMRDPYRYSDAVLIVPPPLIECLRCFDGHQTDLDLRSLLVRITGDLQVGELEQNLIETFTSAGFLEDETFAQMKAGRQREFAEAPKREAAHAGGAYPLEIAALRETMSRYMDGALPSRAQEAPRKGALCAIAAPHVSPEGGWQSYRAAYQALGPELKDRIFVILATSHYGAPEHFGLTRKPFVTPLGETATDTALVNRLEAQGGPAVLMEDYCHSFEHTVELQVVFLQHIYGPDIRILPILCGQYAHSLYRGGAPEADDGVRRFLESLGDMAAREGDRLFWILGIDMAHMGVRYQDDFPAHADQDVMAEVAERDRQRIARVVESDGDGFWSLVQEKHDDLKWCGSAPLYTFLKTLPGVRGELLRYEQWNIDPRSVVSFAGMAFTKP